MMYDLEKLVHEIESENSEIGIISNGSFIFEIKNKIKMTEELLTEYRVMKFEAQNSTTLFLTEAQKYINTKISDTKPNSQNINTLCVNTVNEAMKKLKGYPKYGKIYYEILFLKFIGKEILTYEQIAKKLKCSKPNLLSKKNEAINILASILWGASPSENALAFVETTTKITD